MAQAFKFEFLFDESKAEKSIENVAKSFVDAFNKGKPFDGTKAELEQFVGLASRRLIELSAKYKETQDALRKDGGRASDNPQLKQIQEQINSLRQLRNEAKRAYDSMSQSVKKVDLVSIFTGARHAQGSSNEITNKIRGLENDLKVLKATLKETEEEFAAKGISTKGNAFFERIKSDIAASEAELDGYKARLKEVKEEEKKLSDEQKKARRQMAASNADLQKSFETGRGFSGTNLQLKQEIADTSTELRRLKAQYQETIAAIQKSGGEVKDNPELAKIKDSIDETNAKLHGLRENLKERRMGSENMFQGIAQGAQGLMGAFTAAQGAAAMFGAEEEKLQKIQTKLQASMSILMGLQRLGNALQSTSQFRVQILNKLMEKYHQMNLKVAKSEGIKKLAMAGWAGLIAGAITGITALIIKLSKYADEVKKAKELQKEFREGFTNSASSQMVTLAKLQAGWKATNGDIEDQKRFIYENKSEFESLGLSVKNVADAENALVKNKDKVREAILAKATAAARLAQINSLVAQSMQLQAKLEDRQSFEPKKGNLTVSAINAGLSENGGWAIDQGKTAEAYARSVTDQRAAEIQKEIDDLDSKLQKILEQYVEDLEKITETGGDDFDLNNWQKRQAARIEAARKGYESILRLNEDRENQLTEAKNALIQSNTQREIEQLRLSHEKRMQEIEREKKDYIERLKEQAKLDFLARNPNAEAEDFGMNWKPSSEEQKRINEYYTALADAEAEAYNRSRNELLYKLEQSRREFLKQYGSISDRESALNEEYDYQIKQARQSQDYYKVLELMNKRQEELWKLRNERRIEYIEKYGSSLERELAITERYDHAIEQETDEHRKKMLEMQKQQEIDNLKWQGAGNIIFWDEKQLSRKTLKKALNQATNELERLRKSGKATNEEINIMLQRVQALREQLENTRFGTDYNGPQGFVEGLLKLKSAQEELEESRKKMLEAGTSGTLREFEDALDLVKKNQEDVRKHKEALKSALTGAGVQYFAQGFQRAADAMRDLANLTGDVKLKEFSDQFSAVAQNFSSAAQGFAQGGWIGAIVGGVSDMLSQTINSFTEAKMLEAQAKKNADDWAASLKNVNIGLNEAAYDSPFGSRSLAKGREGMRASLEATKRYQEELAALNRQYSQQQVDEYTKRSKGMTLFGMGLGGLVGLPGLEFIGLGKKVSNEYKAVQDAIQKGYSGLQSMLVKTKDRSGWSNFFGFQDEYTALGDLYPELFKNGELVIENAKRLLETNNALDDSQKEQIKNLVELKEAYDEAIKTVDESISETFGSLSSDITDIIWDSVMNGTDAWAEFKRVGSDSIAALGKQLIQEMVISTYLENFKERMRSAYMLGDSNSTATELRSIFGDIFGGLQGVFEATSGVAQDWKDWAARNGFDLTESASRTAASKAISGVTQESFDDALGRFTAIQSHTYELNETTKTLREQQGNLLAVTSQILFEVQGIHRDTERMQESLDTIQGDMTLVRSGVATMTDRGVRMLN